jgi:hypothetical protein
MRLLRAVVVAAVVLLGLPVAARPAGASGSQCPTWGHSWAPDAGKTLMIVGQDRDSMDAYATGTGVDPGGFMVYTSITAPTVGLLAPGTTGSGFHDMQAELTRFPNSVPQIGLYMVGQLDNINLGVHDGNIAALAVLLRDLNRPVLLRIGYEFDGPWNSYEPGPYVLAFRRIVERMRGSGANNVAFVWHSAAAGYTYGNHPLNAWYPGPCYVDWGGVSIFGGGWNGNLSAATQMADVTAAHGHPVMISESTPYGAVTPTANGDTLWGQWYQPVADWIAAHDVRAWSYINANWDAQSQWAGQGWGDSRVEANAALKARWLAEITKPRYLNASPTLNASLHYPS